MPTFFPFISWGVLMLLDFFAMSINAERCITWPMLISLTPCERLCIAVESHRDTKSAFRLSKKSVGDWLGPPWRIVKSTPYFL